MFCYNLDDLSKIGEAIGGIFGPILAGIAAILLYKTLRSENRAIILQRDTIEIQNNSLDIQLQANDFIVILALYNDLKGDHDSLKFSLNESGNQSILAWENSIMNRPDSFDPNSGFGLKFIIIVKTYDEILQKLDKSILTQEDKILLVNKIGYQYLADILPTMLKIIDKFSNNPKFVEAKYTNAVKYFSDVSRSIGEEIIKKYIYLQNQESKSANLKK